MNTKTVAGIGTGLMVFGGIAYFAAHLFEDRDPLRLKLKVYGTLMIVGGAAVSFSAVIQNQEAIISKLK